MLKNIFKLFFVYIILNTIIVNNLFAQTQFPKSTNYGLRDYEITTGGTMDSKSGIYSIEGASGQTTGDGDSNSFLLRGGILGSQLVHTIDKTNILLDNGLDNGVALLYDRVKISLNNTTACPGGNPIDTTYAIAISKDAGWTQASTFYVKKDDTIGSTLNFDDFRYFGDAGSCASTTSSATSWGGTAGTFITNLEANTTYYIKVKGRQGDFSEGFYTEPKEIKTGGPMITFDMDIGIDKDASTNAPYTMTFGTIQPGQVNEATGKVYINGSTNGIGGLIVFAVSEHGGLYSPGHTIPFVSNNTDLSSVSEGLGVQVATRSDYTGNSGFQVSSLEYTGNTVGKIPSTALSEIFNIPNTPGINKKARGEVIFKTKISASTPASSSYTEKITFVNSANF